MSKGTITIRIGSEIRTALEGLVERGTYRSVTEFAVEALLLKLDLEGVPVEEGFAPPDPVGAYFETPRGQAVLSRAIRRELAAMREAEE
jgi:hypothetical protein